MEEMFFFDANCRIGNGPYGVHPGVDGLLAEMDIFGIDKALVRCNDADQLSVQAFNREISRMVKSDLSGRLTGVWCILPEQCPELPPPEEFFAQMRANRIGAITLFPNAHGFMASKLSLGKILGEAAERKIPVMLYNCYRNEEFVYNFLAEFPNLTAILNAGNKWGTDRTLRPLLEHYENVYLETSGYWVPEGIRDLAEIYGAERLIYGSGFPTFDYGSSMLQLKYSGLPDDAVRKIAGGNLQNLLKGCEL